MDDLREAILNPDDDSDEQVRHDIKRAFDLLVVYLLVDGTDRELPSAALRILKDLAMENEKLYDSLKEVIGILEGGFEMHRIRAALRAFPEAYL